MENCAHSKLELSLDRWQECQWHLHQIEANYHEPEPFRYLLNSFIRAVKEVPLKLQNDLQRHADVKAKTKQLAETVSKNDLFRTLGNQRDFIVHYGALNLKSHGRIGMTKGGKSNWLSPLPLILGRRLTKPMNGTRKCAERISFCVVWDQIVIRRLRSGAHGSSPNFQTGICSMSRLKHGRCSVSCSPA